MVLFAIYIIHFLFFPFFLLKLSHLYHQDGFCSFDTILQLFLDYLFVFDFYYYNYYIFSTIQLYY